MNWFTNKNIRFKIVFSASIVSILIALLAYLSSGGENSSLINIIAFAGILSAISLSIWLSNNITEPINKLVSAAESMAKGDLNIYLDISANDEIGRCVKSISIMLDSMKNQSTIAEAISSGDLSSKVKIKSDKDALSKSINKIVESLECLQNEIKEISFATSEGTLSKRGNPDSFSGAFKDIMLGINTSLDSFSEPIKESIATLNKISSGDLTAQMTSEYKGEIALIKSNINLLTSSFNKALSDVSIAIHATASASNQISSSAEEMAAGAQEQGNQTAEVASSVEQMTKTILETTRNSSRAAEAAKNAGVIAQEGGRVVNETIEGMNRVAEVVKKSAVIVQALGKSSDSIGEIIQVIDDIADQTNLLALNAAIEAARAGEQGRGFAVVADEVRKLAERTTKATKEIANMIKQIQTDTSDAVLSMTSGTVEVEKGKELANLAGKSLGEIIDGAEQVVDMITQVAAASEEQSSAAEEISKNIESINNVSQESALGIQQIAHSAEDLTRLTINLQELISKFKIFSADDNKNVKLTGSIVGRDNKTLMRH